MTTVLASGSPRRKELLEMLEAENLIIMPAQGDEKPPENAMPGEIVMSLSAAKAEEVANRRKIAGKTSEEDVIIAADTIVWNDGKMLGKPRDKEEAFSMLTSLSGKDHEVYTGVTVIRGCRIISEYECTKVHFRSISPEEISAYIATGEPMDKAGAYAVQGKGSLFITGLNGDFFNVMGLPLCRLGSMLRKLGVVLL